MALAKNIKFGTFKYIYYLYTKWIYNADSPILGFTLKYKNQFIRKKKIQIVGLDNWVVSKKRSEAITQI